MLRVGCCLFLVLTFSSIAASAAGPSDIQGTVSTSATRHGVDRPVLVRLLSGQNAVQELLTDFSGRFRFRKVPPGSYVVRVEVEGYYHKDVPVVMSGSDSKLSIVLEAAPTETGFSGALDPFAGLDIPKRAQKELEQGLREQQKSGQCEKAMPHFSKAIDLYPRYSEAYSGLGSCYLKQGKNTAAEEALKKAASFSRTIYPAINLADFYASQKRFDEAQDLLVKLLPKNPTEGDLYAALARIYFAIGRLHDAEIAGLQAASRSHQSADIHLLLAKIYEGQHNKAAQMTQLRAYLDEGPPGATADEVRKQLLGLSGSP